MSTDRGAKVRVKELLVVANPAAGKDQAVLSTLNGAFREPGIHWEITVTQDPGDAEKAARDAAAGGKFDAVAAYGGDGTVMEVAAGLAGTDMPLAILPGGTANVMAREMGVPTRLQDAAQALAGEMIVRRVDLGEVETEDGEKRLFALRVGAGLEADMVENATREQKDRLGELAYVLAALKELKEPKTARYKLTMDGTEEEVDGLSVMVSNSGAIPHVEARIAQDILVDDGLLDVLVATRADLQSVVAVASAIASGEEPPDEPVKHWQAKEIVVRADPVQRAVMDGETLGTTPLTIRVLPGAVKVLVPPEPEAGGTSEQTKTG